MVNSSSFYIIGGMLMSNTNYKYWIDFFDSYKKSEEFDNDFSFLSGVQLTQEQIETVNRQLFWLKTKRIFLMIISLILVCIIIVFNEKNITPAIFLFYIFLTAIPGYLFLSLFLIWKVKCKPTSVGYPAKVEKIMYRKHKSSKQYYITVILENKKKIHHLKISKSEKKQITNEQNILLVPTEKIIHILPMAKGEDIWKF